MFQDTRDDNRLTASVHRVLITETSKSDQVFITKKKQETQVINCRKPGNYKGFPCFIYCSSICRPLSVAAHPLSSEGVVRLVSPGCSDLTTTDPADEQKSEQETVLQKWGIYAALHRVHNKDVCTNIDCKHVIAVLI